jgi:hypothetical protein
LIPEADIEKAVEYLRQSAQDAAEARATVKYIGEYLKAKIAQLKGCSDASSNAAQEDYARAHPEYLELLNGYRAAVEKDSFHQFKRDAAAAMIDAWRTQCSNARVEGKL